MSKSILVIDTPETCLDCRFCRELHEGIEVCCELSDEPNDKELCRMIEADYCQENPDWCPMKDAPEYKNLKNERDKDIALGWNRCLSELLEGGDAE